MSNLDKLNLTTYYCINTIMKQPFNQNKFGCNEGNCLVV